MRTLLVVALCSARLFSHMSRSLRLACSGATIGSPAKRRTCSSPVAHSLRLPEILWALLSSLHRYGCCMTSATVFAASSSGLVGLKSGMNHLSARSFRKPFRCMVASMPTNQLNMICMLMNLCSTGAVCPTCKGACDGCTAGTPGGTCPWITTVAANAAAVVATTAAGIITARSLLPPGLLQAFPRAALDAILLLARMPPAGTPFDLTAATTAADLRIAYRQGRLSKADVAEGISSLISRHSSGSSATDLTLLQLQIKTLELELSEPEPQSRTEIGGVFVYLLSRISQFVLKTQTPQWARNVQERSGASLSATLYFPAPQIADGAVPVICHLFVMVVHAFGLEHLHAVGPFIHRVVNESVWLHDYTWSYAYELLLIYLKALDERRMGISMANIWDSGSQDTFAKNAAKSAVQRWGPDFAFFRTHGGIPGNKQSAASTSAAAANNAGATTNTKWNGRFTKDAKPCLTFNNGRSEHPRSCLLADGTCKFNHVCDHFLDDGKKCGSAAHGRHACDNLNKRLPQQ